MRYRQLDDIIREKKPQSIIEVGTWRGDRALQMINAALLYNDSVNYEGYDLFEESPELDSREFNVKRRATMKSVEARFRRHQSLKGFQFTIIPGDTRHSLPYRKADLAFIDGGHSVETILNDYEKLAACRTIVLDDYYEPDENGVMPDTTKFGCNRLVEGFEPHWFKILPEADPVKGGGLVKMVLIENE